MSTSQPNATRKQVVIVGGGFAGLAAAQELRRADCDVTLIDQRNFHLFQPLLYQVATGELSPANIAAPLRAILRRQRNTAVELGEVVGFDLKRHRVLLRDHELPFDYLVLATGSTQHYFGHQSWKKFAPGLKTVEDATDIRRRILSAFEVAERSHDAEQIDECLTFVIVGAGPTGCELAGALAEVAYQTLAADFRRIDPKRARILLIDPSGNPLDFYPAPLPVKAAEALQELGVKIIRGCYVTDVKENAVTLHSKADDTDTVIRTRTVLWAAGVKASPLGEALCGQAGIETGRGGRVPVTSDCSIEGFPNIFVCGDLAIFIDPDDGELPGLAPVAGQMGRHAAESMKRDLKNKPRKAFRYFDKGSLAVIGRFRAVGTIGKWKLHGFVAWAIWLLIHLMYITRFRNRVLVLIQWGWAFFTRDRSSRLITGPPTEQPAKDIPQESHSAAPDRRASPSAMSSTDPQ